MLRRSLPRSVVLQTAKRLAAEYPPDRLYNRRDPVSETVFIILSGQTEEYNYLRTYIALRKRFRTWDRVRMADEADISRTISLGGLGQKKAHQIREALETIYQANAEVSLEALRSRSDAAAEDFLTQLSGVGTKSARCILMYSLARPVFPVDTHVWRIWHRLGHPSATRPRPKKPTRAAQDELQRLVPPDLRRPLHVAMVQHGRRICTASDPKCSECVLSDICRSGPAISKGLRTRS